MAAWQGGGYGLSLAFRLGSNLIMTRLLAPEAFGLMGLIFAIQGGLVMMTDVGLRPSVIRSPIGDDPSFLRTAWTIQIVQHGLIAAVLGLIVAALLVLQQTEAVVGGSVYADPDLPPILAASMVIVLAQGLRSTNIALAERRMSVGVIIIIDLSSQIITAVIMIGVALIYPSVWALMIGTIFGSVTRVLLSHLAIAGPKMALCWRRDVASEIWESGKWLIGASTLGFFASQGDRLVLAALFDTRTFGLYAIATIWVSAVREGVNAVMRSTSFTAMSEIGRTRPEEIARLFARLRVAQDIIGFMGFIIILITGPYLIALLYTDEYHGAAPIMSLLAGQLLLLRYGAFNDLLLRAGDTQGIARISLVGCVSMLLLPLIFFSIFGTNAAIIAVALNGAWSAPMAIQRGARYVPLNVTIEHLVLAAIILASVSYVAFASLVD